MSRVMMSREICKYARNVTANYVGSCAMVESIGTVAALAAVADASAPTRCKNNNSPHPLPPSVPFLQNEWDDLMLETFTLKQHLDQTRQELSQALYQVKINKREGEDMRQEGKHRGSGRGKERRQRERGTGE